MGYKKRTLEELNVIDDFLITAAASGEEGEDFCRKLISVLLNKKVGKVHITAQSGIPGYSPEHRGIRLDVEIEEGEDENGQKLSVANIYDLEPHLSKSGDFLKHNRFYQAKIDGRYVKSGLKDFSRMPNLYVIIITPYDPFGYDYMLYTIQNKCNEISELSYEDGLAYYYFYTGGNKGGSREIKEMLRYIQNSSEENAANETIREVHSYISKVKLLPEVKESFMRFDEIIAYEREEAIGETREKAIMLILEEKGRVKPETQKALHEKLMAESSQDDTGRLIRLALHAASAEEFLKEMDRGML